MFIELVFVCSSFATQGNFPFPIIPIKHTRLNALELPKDLTYYLPEEEVACKHPFLEESHSTWKLTKQASKKASVVG